MTAVSLIEKILTSPAGSFGFVVALLGLAFYLVHWITKKVTEIQTKHNSLSEATQKVDKYIDTLREDISFIKGSIASMRNSINTDQSLAQAHSPISLTPKGIAMAEEINIDEMVNQNWDKIQKQINADVADKNAYDIQQYCIETAAVAPERFFSTSDILLLKQFAYRKGRLLQDISIIPAIKIRDRYMQEKGIAVDEIDKHDPNR